jgi:molybdopterin-guanine dinucleotide biosynthesis protein A
MGRPKATLEWHGSTLLHRVTGIVGRAVDGGVVVVRAAGQELPELPPGVRVVEDAAEDRGPLQGLAAGLAAVAGEAGVAYVSSTDVPLLHPAFVRVVARAASGEDVEVAAPVSAGIAQPLAAAYRTSLVSRVEELIAEGEQRATALLERSRVRELSEDDLLADPELAAADPELLSLMNLNEPGDYTRARAREAPSVTVRLLGGLARNGADPLAVHAATLAAAAAAAGVVLGDAVRTDLNGKRIANDPELPLAGRDELSFTASNQRG